MVPSQLCTDNVDALLFGVGRRGLLSAAVW